MSDIRQLWQNQESETDMMTLTDIQGRSGKFRGRIRWRNILIGGYSLFTAAFLSRWLLMHPDTQQARTILPAILLLLPAHLWVVFALWWRGRARPLPDDLGGAAALDFHRRELEHQRAAAASAWAWYILPFAPVTAVMFWMMTSGKLPTMHGPAAFTAILFTLVFWGAVWLAFSRSAARIELELERLKRLHAE